MITANKGEWSEVYALFKLLSEGKLYAGDKDLNKIPNLIYPIISILRQESQDLLTYSPEPNHGVVHIQNGTSTFTISQSDFKCITEFLLTEIKKNNQQHPFLFLKLKPLYLNIIQRKSKLNPAQK